MNGKLPDAAMLDALLLGADDEEALEAWNDLLTLPDAADRWQEAVSRREQLDRFSMVLITHPWIARTMARLREFQSSGTSPSPGSCEAVLAPELMAHFLGSPARPETRLALPRRGEVEAVQLAHGDIIELRPAPDHVGDFRVFYRSTTGEGPLPRRRWRMEAGEAPVLLLAVSASDAHSLETALQHSTVLGGVILLEAPRAQE